MRRPTPSGIDEVRTLRVMRVVIFDDGLAELAALADLRPVFDVRTGRDTSRARLERAIGARADAALIPDTRADLARESADIPINPPDVPADALFVNGRCVLPPNGLADLAPGSAMIEARTGAVIAARLARDDARTFARSLTLPAGVRADSIDKPCVLHRPWDVIRFRDAAIADDLAALGRDARATGDLGGRALRAGREALPGSACLMGEHEIYVHPTAVLAPGAVLDSSKGVVAIDEHVVVRPGAIIVGPASIGPHSTILEHAFIKANTAIGPWCKIAGEVGGTIVQGFSNKGHDGHLGDAWLGEWVNLGAGTINSNLLNTYGEVGAAATPASRREKTGLTFLGCVLGDHVKTAIGTRIMTGSMIGTGAMLASTTPPPTCVGRFAWITDAGATRYKLERFLDAAERMMQRRGVALTPALRASIAFLHGAGA